MCSTTLFLLTLNVGAEREQSKSVSLGLRYYYRGLLDDTFFTIRMMFALHLLLILGLSLVTALAEGSASLWGGFGDIRSVCDSLFLASRLLIKDSTGQGYLVSLTQMRSLTRQPDGSI